MKLITLYLPESYIKALDQLVGERFFPNRSEAVRSSVRDLLVEFSRFQGNSSWQVKTDYKAPDKNVLDAVEKSVQRQERHTPRRFS